MSAFRFLTPGNSRKAPARTGDADALSRRGSADSSSRASARGSDPSPSQRSEATLPLKGLSRLDWNSLVIPSSPFGPVDSALAAVTIALIGFGVVMVYSASAIEIRKTITKDPQFFLVRQALFGFLALAAMWIFSRIDYRQIRKVSYAVLGGVVLLLSATLVIGRTAGHATRWIQIGAFNIQASEVAKLGIVFWLAFSLSKKRDLVRSFKLGFVPDVLVVGVLCLLCLKQPDFGSAVVLVALTFTMLFIAGARIAYILGALGLGLGAAYWLITGTEYRMRRYLAWSDLLGSRDGLSYQPYQSVLSFGSGGTFGQGLGKGLQVLYLPEAHTDFISAIIGEELGFVGIVGLCAAYALLVSRGVKIALEAHDDYGTFLAFGISSLFGIQALVNLAVAMAMIPTKGLTLPFLSYGGSSLLVSAAAVGVLLNISRPRRPVTEASEEKTLRAAAAPSAGAVVMHAAEDGGAR